MSMISVQCDELRDAARGQKAMGLFELAQMLNDAADTITELRGALQVASVDYRHLKDENANLRERITTQKQTIQAYRDESREWREVAECAQAENAKLRECLQDLAEHIREDDGFGLDYGWMLDRMRELGVEVDE